MPKSHMISVVNLTHQAAAYADGDSIGGSPAITIPVSAGVSVHGLELIAVRIIDRDGNAPDLDLHLFNTPPANLATVLAENGAVTFADGDVAGGVYLGFVDVNAADYVTGAGVSVANKELTDAIRVNAGYSRQLTLVAVLRTAAGETYTETTAIDIEFIFNMLA